MSGLTLMTKKTVTNPGNEPPRAFRTDEHRRQAVRERDRAADGLFFYSVQTTGVYCRPSCAARLPRRENVGFHLTCADAERAGFGPANAAGPMSPRSLIATPPPCARLAGASRRRTRCRAFRHWRERLG